MSKVQLSKILSDYEKGWLEALIDGEGSLSLNFKKQKTSLRPGLDCRISISNINLELLERAKNIIGGGHIHLRKGKNNRRDSYVYSCSHTLIRNILPQLNLIVKKEQKEILLSALSLMTQKGSPKGYFSAPLRPKWKDNKLLRLKKKINELNLRGSKIRNDPDVLLISRQEFE